MWNLLEGQGVNVAPSGYVAEVNEDCNGCGICAEDVCHFSAITMDEAEPGAVIDFDKCMGCGVCQDVCPVEAISLRREPSKGEPLDIEELTSIGKTAGARAALSRQRSRYSPSLVSMMPPPASSITVMASLRGREPR